MFSRFFFCIIFAASIFFTSGCTPKKKNIHTKNIIAVGTCADYPPFEHYTKEGVLEGFDVSLMRCIAKILKKDTQFENLEFSVVFAALETKRIDVGISTISITPERQRQFDFIPYYTQTLYAVMRKNSSKELHGKILSCQMGTTMETWIKTHHPAEQCIMMDANPELIEALKAKRVDVVVLDGYQAKEFCSANNNLIYIPLGESDVSCGIALPKNSPLYTPIKAALEELKKNGTFDALQRQYNLE